MSFSEYVVTKTVVIYVNVLLKGLSYVFETSNPCNEDGLPPVVWGAKAKPKPKLPPRQSELLGGVNTPEVYLH